MAKPDESIDPRQFVLIQDEDCHWYVCPADKEEEASEYFEEVSQYWDTPRKSGDPPVMPDYLDRVGGAPSLVKFTGYTIG